MKKSEIDLTEIEKLINDAEDDDNIISIRFKDNQIILIVEKTLSDLKSKEYSYTMSDLMEIINNFEKQEKIRNQKEQVNPALLLLFEIPISQN